MKVLYLHSNKVESKINTLYFRGRFPNWSIATPKVLTDPMVAEPLIEEALTSESVVLVGVGLGGFYALYFAMKYRIPCVLVNPDTKPNEYKDSVLHDYQAGHPFDVSSDQLIRFSEMVGFIHSNYCGSLVSLLLSRDDGRIPHKRTIYDLPSTAMTAVVNGSGHDFSKHWWMVGEILERKFLY